MNRVDTLKEQAAILRSLAASFDAPDIRATLLDLADRCEKVAQEMERSILWRQSQPIDPTPR